MAKRKMPEVHDTKAIEVTSAVSDSEVTKFKPFTGKVVKCDKLNVRKEASFDSSIVSIISHGDILNIIGEDGDFYMVLFNDTTCYVAKAYIKEI